MAKSTSTPTVDELDAALETDGLDELDAALDELQTETAHEVEEVVDLSSLQLAGVIEMDFRLLPDKTWLDCVIVKAKGGRSGAGNLQAEFVYQVQNTDIVDAEGKPACGVTLSDQAGVDPRKPEMHWKIKKIAKRVGLLGPNDQIMTKNLADFVGRRLRVLNAVDDKFDPTRPRNKAGDFDFPTEPNAAFTPSA